MPLLSFSAIQQSFMLDNWVAPEVCIEMGQLRIALAYSQNKDFQLLRYV
jgi:hypothetical protein